MSEQTAGKRLILHIGGAKCGSTAIQNYLGTNAGGLAERGVLIPPMALDDVNSPTTGEQVIFFEDLLYPRMDGQDHLSHCLYALSDRMSREGLRTAIISGENMSLHPELAEMFRIAAVDFDITVVLYVRRQDDFLISAWQQWGMKYHSSLEDYAANGIGILADWAAILAAWEDAFGRDRIIVRRYQRDSLYQDDAVADFVQAIGLSPEGLTPLEKFVNLSFDEHLGDLAFRIRDVFDGPHDNDFFHTMAGLLAEKVHKRRSASHLMSLSQRLAFLDSHAAGNEEVKQRYFPELGSAPLFAPPTASNVELLSENEKLQAENALLTRAVYALTKRIEEIEARLNGR